MDNINLMIDIETMSTLPNAAVIQIGACSFDNRSGEILSEILLNIDLNDSIRRGFKTDPKTEAWWRSQDQNILKGILENALPVADAMEKFSAFLKKNTIFRSTPIWSHATFDFPRVQNYLNAAFLPGMNYKMAYDIRTLTGLSDLNLNAYDWSNKTHNALDDCRFQVKYCTDALNRLRNHTEATAPTKPTTD